jgi:dolichol kinase
MSIELEIIEIDNPKIDEQNLQLEIPTSVERDWRIEREYGYALIYISSFFMLIILIIYTIFVFDKTDSEILFLKKFLLYSSYILTAWILGKLKQNYNIKTNYTRKINHIVVWFIPYLVDVIISVSETTLSNIWNVALAIIGLVIWTEPIRNFDKTGFIETTFLAIDRPEDRPNTLKWITYQAIGTGATVIPFSILFNQFNKPNYILIPLMILTFGDGLAEPIGIRFGKHKYKVKAIGSSKEYTRSVEGSACVFISAITILAILHEDFNNYELIANIIFLPIIATLTEAFSPHTLDNPILFTICSSVISLTHIIFQNQN